MQQPCSRCGYISDRPARFCRQCGSQLFDETDVTAATTRNIFKAGQERQQSPQQFPDQQSAGYAPGYTPGGWAEQTPGTSPFYQAPMATQYQQPVVEQKKSFNWGKWILISFLSFLMFAVLVGGSLFWWGKTAIERAIERNGGFSEPVVVNVPPIPEVPPPPGGEPAPEAASVTLESLKYPNSTVVGSNKAPFTQTIQMTTDDDLETVKKYYDKKFGETFKDSATSIQSSDDEEKHVYVSLSHPLITIEIEPDKKDSDKTRISIARVNAPIPKLVFPEELRRNRTP